MRRLVIEFGSSRDRCGRLTIFGSDGKRICGPFPVAGRASTALALARGNSCRDPLGRYGDTPTGAYVVRQFIRSGRGTHFGSAEYGPHGVFVLEGISGDAACAEANGRFHILICGGALSPNGALRTTAGALRLRNEDQHKLVLELKHDLNAQCDILERLSVVDKNLIFDDPACVHQDPPLLPEQTSQSRVLKREMLRGTAAGAALFSFAVSFVALQGSTPAHAEAAPATRTTSSLRDQSGLPAASLPSSRYVKLAYNGATAASGAMQQLQNATSGQQTTGQTFDNGPGPSDATPTGGGNAVAVPPSVPVSEPPLTPQQQQQLSGDQQYQQYQQQYSGAQKAATDAAAREQQIQSQINSTADSAQKSQLQVDLAKARQDESNANSAAAAARINAQQRKKVILQGAPIKED